MKFMEAVEACFKGKKCSTERHNHKHYMAYSNGKLYWFDKSNDKLLSDVNVGPWLNTFANDTFEIYEKPVQHTDFECGIIYKRNDGEKFTIVRHSAEEFQILSALCSWCRCSMTKQEIIEFLNQTKCLKVTKQTA